MGLQSRLAAYYQKLEHPDDFLEAVHLVLHQYEDGLAGWVRGFVQRDSPDVGCCLDFDLRTAVLDRCWGHLWRILHDSWVEVPAFGSVAHTACRTQHSVAGHAEVGIGCLVQSNLLDHNLRRGFATEQRDNHCWPVDRAAD